MMKAIILARVSDKKQDSNEAQLARIFDYVGHKKLTIWKKYEIEESSTKGDREKFQEVIKIIKQSKETIALVADTVDRLQRSFKESVQMDELRKAGKIEIHFYRENLIIHKESNSADILRWDMAVMFAKSYVLQLSDNVKRKFELKRRNGEWSGKAPIGYMNIGEEKNNKDIVFDPESAPLIRRVFELYASKMYSMKTLRDEMTRAGLRSSLGTPIAPSMIEFILTNPFYYGVMLSNGKLYPHKYQPLITRQLFDRCQQVRKSWNKKPFQYAAKPYIFRGLLRCAKCGCSMSPETAKGKFVYYSCTNARKDICSKKVYVPEKVLLKPIYRMLRALSKIPQETIDRIVDGIKQSNASKGLYHKQVIETLQSEYGSLQTKIGRLMDLLLDGSILKQDYEQKLDELKNRQYDINIQLEDHTRADRTYYITASTVLHLAKNALQTFESSEVPEKRALLNYLLQNSVVDGKTPLYTLRSPFNTLLKLNIFCPLLRALDVFRTLDWALIERDLEFLHPLQIAQAA